MNRTKETLGLHCPANITERNKRGLIRGVAVHEVIGMIFNQLVNLRVILQIYRVPPQFFLVKAHGGLAYAQKFCSLNLFQVVPTHEFVCHHGAHGWQSTFDRDFTRGKHLWSRVWCFLEGVHIFYYIRHFSESREDRGRNRFFHDTEAKA